MLRAEDLMLGNWVMYNPNKFIDDEYESPKPTHPIQIKCGEEIDLAIEGCYSPIPITPEILEKNGFGYIERDEHLNHFYLGESQYCRDMDLHIGTDNNGHFWLNCISGEMKEIRFIHELQNAFRLFRIEHEIKL